MAIYRKGTASIDANGVVTGNGTDFKTALTLIRIGATMIFLSGEKPVLATVDSIVSETEIRTINSGGQVASDGDYVILLTDALTVEGLAQDVAETLRYYQSSETAVADLADQIPQYIDEAKQSAKDAAESNETAKTSETNAKTSETNSASSASSASSYKDEAAASAQSASEYKDQAAQSATDSANSASESEQSNQQSKQYADLASGSADNAAASAKEAADEVDKLGILNDFSKTIDSVNGSDVVFKGSVEADVEASTDKGLVTLRQLLSATSGGGSGGASMTGVMNNFIGQVSWFNGSRALLPTGNLSADGQILNRSDYPDLWEAVNGGLFPSVSDDLWLNSGNSSSSWENRAKFSTGDGSTSFRMPDLNGIQSGSMGGIFLSAAAKSLGSTIPARDVGKIYDQNAPNVKGEMVIANSSSGSIFDSGSGALQPSGTQTTNLFNLSKINDGGSSGRYGNFSIDASRNSSVYKDNNGWLIPVSASGIWIIRVSGAFKAANTSFDVVNSVTELPSSGTVVYGGDVRSNFTVNGTTNSYAAMRVKYTVGGAKTVELRLNDSGTETAWTMPTNAGALALSSETYGPAELNTPYINMTLQAGWKTISRAVYRKIFGMVYMDVHITGGAYNDGTVLFGVQPAYRPVANLHVVPFAVASSGTIPPRVIISPNGQVTCNNVGGNGDLHFTIIYCVE